MGRQDDPLKNVSITIVRRIAFPPKTVFRAWTDPRTLVKWLAPGGDRLTSVTTDIREGGRYRLEGVHAEGTSYSICGTYRKVVANRLISFTWNYDGPIRALRGGSTVVLAEMTGLNDGSTELTLTHERHPERESAEVTRVAWQSCVDKLEQVAACLVDETTSEKAPRDFFTDAQREVQDRTGSRPMADRLEAVLVHDRLSAADAAFVTRQNMVFLATNDAHDQPQCSYKGGAKGFVSVIDDETLAFPDYDGNGMHLSVGNIDDTRRVGLLFVDFEKQARMRVLGRASVSACDQLLARYPGAARIIRVRVDSVFSNCPRYVHKMQLIEESVYVPADGARTPDPTWKRLNAVADVLMPEDRELAGSATDLNRGLNRDS